MKKLYLTLQQAESLADDLKEYANMKDSNNRELFKGFEISFGDLLAQAPQSGESFEMTPIPEFTEIPADDDS